MQTIHDLDAAWAEPSSGKRLELLTRAGVALHDLIKKGPRVVSVRTFPLTTLPYPSTYAFAGAARSPAPFVILTHRAMLVQYFDGSDLRNLLFNPSDVERARETPYFKSLAKRFALVEPMVAKKFPPLHEQLNTAGVSPSSIDWIAFDHFHTQDLRRILGSADGSYPNAKLLAPACEWNDWDNLHPLQRPWFVKDGKAGIDPARVQLTSSDLRLGEGVYLLRTPGHTSGNQTLFVHTDSGIWGTSENGTAADSWSPLDSQVNGVRAHAQSMGLDLLMNANTLEHAAAQMCSMALERAVVDRYKRAPAFVQMFPSSEVTPHPFAPGLKPTVVFNAIEHGSVVHSK